MAIIASDIPEVVGSAFGMNMLFGIPLWLGVLIVRYTFSRIVSQKKSLRQLDPQLVSKS
jgi:Mn2+/Fe2+ NRAMP family transporter